MCFHSIGFPCERGATIAVNIGGNIKSFHSIGFPCERGAPAPAPAPAAPEPAPEFPFNWFPLREGRLYVLDDTQRAALFPFNWFPLREGSLEFKLSGLFLHRCFHSIGFPCERGVSTYSTQSVHAHRSCFHSIGFPCERGAACSKNKFSLMLGSSFHSIGFPCERGVY